jgi:hypothetical protein
VAYFNLQDFSGWLNRKKKYQPEIKSPSHEWRLVQLKHEEGSTNQKRQKNVIINFKLL